MSTFQFHIPEPCHEDWGKMTPKQQGRFCDACQKCVVDLTAKQPQEIRSLYEEHGGNMCGRVRVSQLSQPKTQARPAIRPIMNGALRRLQRFALALLLAGGLLSLTPHQAKAQTEVGQVQVKMGKVAYVPTNVIEGAVRTEEGKAEGVTVRLLNEEGDELATTRTDGKGHYRFEGRWFGDVSVTASHHGAYAHESLQLGRGVEKRVDLELYERMLMGDVMPYPEPDGDPEVIEHIEEPEIDPLPEPSPGVVYPDERILMGDTVLLPEVAEPMIMGSIQAPVDTPRPETQGPESLLRHFQQDGSFAEPGQKTRIEAGGFRATIFPNPTLDKVFVTASEPGGPELKVLLTDMGGRVLRLEDWRPGWNPVHVVDISHLPAGTYMLRLLDKEGGGEGTRIVKQ